MADRIDILSKKFDFTKIKTYFEIGGGFGSNIHFLLTNFKNIKKVIYLDVVPNICVGTEYLRYFYKENVKDYLSTKNSTVPALRYCRDECALHAVSPILSRTSEFRAGEPASSRIFWWRLCKEQSRSPR